MFNLGITRIRKSRVSTGVWLIEFIDGTTWIYAREESVWRTKRTIY